MLKAESIATMRKQLNSAETKKKMNLEATQRSVALAHRQISQLARRAGVSTVELCYKLTDRALFEASDAPTEYLATEISLPIGKETDEDAGMAAYARLMAKRKLAAAAKSVTADLTDQDDDDDDSGNGDDTHSNDGDWNGATMSSTEDAVSDVEDLPAVPNEIYDPRFARQHSTSGGLLLNVNAKSMAATRRQQHSADGVTTFLPKR